MLEHCKCFNYKQRDNFKMQGTNSGESSPIAESQETGKLKITKKLPSL